MTTNLWNIGTGDYIALTEDAFVDVRWVTHWNIFLVTEDIKNGKLLAIPVYPIIASEEVVISRDDIEAAIDADDAATFTNY